MKFRQIGLAAALFLISVSAQAEWWGAPSGRSANPANNPDMSVEGAFSTSGDYQNIGARFNYTLNESMTIYGDFGLGDFIDDGTSFGAGLYYYLPSLSKSASFLGRYDFAAQGSYHQLSGDFGVSALSLAMLVSPKIPLIPANGLNWYGNVGLTRLSVDLPGYNFGFGRIGGGSVTSTEIQIGGGVYMPVGPGSVYAGVDMIDEFILGIGYRFGIQ